MRALIVLLLLAGCSSFEEKQAHNQAQIDIIRVQREAQKAERVAEAESKKALYQALAEVARANPEQAGAVTVALAVQGITEEEDGATPIIGLQKAENTGLEIAKAVLPSVVNLATGLGVAAINADVAKTQSNNAARIQINDAEQDANIVNAVAGLGRVALENNGTSISVSDNGYVNTGSYTDDNSVVDSYNTTDNSTDNSDNSTDNSDNSTDNSDNSTDSTTNNYAGDEYVTNEYVTNEYVTYEGQEFTLAGLLEYLRGTGLAYNLTIGDTTYTVDGEGEPTDIDCVEPGVPQFSPALPVCES